MRVDVINVATCATRLLQRATCDANGAESARCGEGDELRVGRCSVADDLRERRGATGERKIESLEQLRAMEHGYSIAVLPLLSHPGAGVDAPPDLERVRRIVAQRINPSG